MNPVVHLAINIVAGFIVGVAGMFVLGLLAEIFFAIYEAIDEKRTKHNRP